MPRKPKYRILYKTWVLELGPKEGLLDAGGALDGHKIRAFSSRAEARKEARYMARYAFDEEVVRPRVRRATVTIDVG